jgi:hypothetical protein
MEDSDWERVAGLFSVRGLGTIVRRPRILRKGRGIVASFKWDRDRFDGDKKNKKNRRSN